MHRCINSEITFGNSNVLHECQRVSPAYHISRSHLVNSIADAPATPRARLSATKYHIDLVYEKTHPGPARFYKWWRHQIETFPRYLCEGIYRSPVDSPQKGQWREALMLSLIFASTNGWANSRDASDLRRNRALYGVIVMINHRLLRNILPIYI